MKKKVLFCVPPNCGGAERVTLTIAKLLDKEQYDVTIVIVGKTKGEIIEFVPDYFDVVHVKIRNIWDFTTFRLVRLFRKLCPNIVFCSLMYLNIRVILAAHIVGGIKTIVRNNIGFDMMRFDKAFLIKKIYPYADIIILQTDEMKKEMKKNVKICDEKLRVIFNPIDVDLIAEKLKNISSPFNSEYTNYVFVGRIDYSKGLDILIKAFARVVDLNRNSRLYLIGKIISTNKYYCSLVKLITDLNLDSYIEWVGFTTNPYQYVKYANCLVLPSRVEGLPNVILDAMYLRTPVVVTRSVPVIDRLVSSSRGIIVDVEDIDSLVHAMYKVIQIEITEDYKQASVAELRSLFN